MPHQPAQSTAQRWSAEEVGAHIAATHQFLARSHQHANQAMAQARSIDRLLHGTSQRSDAAERAEATRSEHLVEVMQRQLAAHERAAGLRAQSQLLREQVATAAEALAVVEQEVARVHRILAAQGGPQAGEAREHAERAEAFAAKEWAEAERLRTVEPN